MVPQKQQIKNLDDQPFTWFKTEVTICITIFLFGLIWFSFLPLNYTYDPSSWLEFYSTTYMAQ